MGSAVEECDFGEGGHLGVCRQCERCSGRIDERRRVGRRWHGLRGRWIHGLVVSCCLSPLAAPLAEQTMKKPTLLLISGRTATDALEVDPVTAAIFGLHDV